MAETPSPRRPRVPKPAAKGIAQEEPKSRQKAKLAADTGKQQMDLAERSASEGGPPLTADGRPLAKITVAGAELIPHGQFANISCGPAMFEIWVDPLDEEPVSDEMASGIAKAANKVFDALYGDVLSVQRALIQKAIDEQAAAG
jgi:hypothetical protein